MNEENNINISDTEEEKKYFNLSVSTWIAIGICGVIFLFLGIILFNSGIQTYKANNHVEIFVERPRPKHPFAAMKILPKMPMIKAGERFKFEIGREVYFSEGMKNVHLLVKIPTDITNRQKIYNLKISPTPRRIVDKADGKYAEIFLQNPAGAVHVSIKGEAAVRTYNLENAKKVNKNIDGVLSNEDKKYYLREEVGIETKSRYISNLAKEIPTATNDVDTVKFIFDYIFENMFYDRDEINKDKGALAALHSGRGVCEEFSKAFVALCRAKKIPARIVIGFDIPFTDNKKDVYPGHVWTEVYLTKYGWVTFDPTNEIPQDNRKKAENLRIYPYDLLYGIIQYKNYLIADVKMVTAKYEGEGSISSKNLGIKFSK